MEVKVKAKDAVSHGAYRLARGEETTMPQGIARDLEKAGFIEVVTGDSAADDGKPLEQRAGPSVSRGPETSYGPGGAPSEPGAPADGDKAAGQKAAEADATRGTQATSPGTADRRASTASTAGTDAAERKGSDALADANTRAEATKTDAKTLTGANTKALPGAANNKSA